MVNELPVDKLLELAPYLVIYGKIAFDHGVRRGQNIEVEQPSAQKLIKLMRKKGITGEQVIDNLFDFQIPKLGEGTAQFIQAIAGDLENPYNFDSSSGGTQADMLIGIHKKIKEGCVKENHGRKKPFELESVLKIGAEPVAVNYSSGGRLYVFDKFWLNYLW